MTFESFPRPRKIRKKTGSFFWSKQALLQEVKGRKIAMSMYDFVKDCQPSALVFHCGDPRLKKTFRQFLKEELRLKEEDYVAPITLGGAAPFAQRKKINGGCLFLTMQAYVALSTFSSIGTICLIAHEGCSFYTKMNLRDSCDKHQEKTDLTLASKEIELIAPGKRIVLYYGRFCQNEKIIFEYIKS